MSYILNKDLPTECFLQSSEIDDVSLSFTLFQFRDKGDIAAIYKFIGDFLFDLLQESPSNRSILSATVRGSYVLANKNISAHDGIVLNKTNVEIERNSRSIENGINKLMQFLFAPAHKDENTDPTFDVDFDENPGSDLVMLHEIISFSCTIAYPFEYYAKGINVDQRFDAGLSFNRYVKYCPYNTDSYCFFHTIFNFMHNKFDKTTFTSLNRNSDYMEEFNLWFNEHNLERFYANECLNLNKIEEIEDQLKISINLYTFDPDLSEKSKKSVELYARSSYKYDPIVYVLLVPLGCFTNKKTKTKNYPVVNNLIDKQFVRKNEIKDFAQECHAIELKLSFFKGKHDKFVCKYCTYSCGMVDTLETHEKLCKPTYENGTKADRVRVYHEMKNPIKKFQNWASLYKIPFATYDFETRLVEGQHVPFSYSICYFNVFKPEKSEIILNYGRNSERLIQEFLDDVGYIAKKHKQLQSVDDYVAGDKTSDLCGFCKEEYTEKNPAEWNHCHFEDSVNTHLDQYICKGCNHKCKMKTKGVKFYAHNGAKFDQLLFLKELFNREDFQAYSFIAKNETRMTEIKVSYVDNSTNEYFPLTFNDSILLLQGSLVGLIKAWITKDDHKETIKILLKIAYPELNSVQIEQLLKISLGKAVFPYSCLNDREHYRKTDAIDRELFFNVLYNCEISDEDYAAYLEAHKVLKEILPNYNFLEYHNYYLYLDTILLAVVMQTFFEESYGISGVNPLFYLSSSSYSYNALLKYNLDHEKYDPIVIPNAEIQLWLNNHAVRGGFSCIFNRKPVDFNPETDFIIFNDFCSLYPSVFSESKLPYKHYKSNITPTMEDLTAALNCADYYHFVEVDIDPLREDLHAKISKFPLFPENLEIKEEYLSDDQKHRYKLNTGKDFKPMQTNTVSFFAKKNYVVSARYLKFAVDLGYTVSRVHRIETFEESYFMKDYTDVLYKQKEEASILRGNYEEGTEEYNTLSSLRDLYKLMMCGCYGFNLVNVNKFKNIELLDSENPILKKRVSSFKFSSLLHLDNKVILNMQKPSYTLSYCTSAGAAILEESKLKMLRAVYTILDYFPDDVYPLFTDTDSAMLQLKNFYKYFDSVDEFFYKFNKDNYTLFDTTHSAKKYQMPETHEALGLFGSETKNKTISEFYGICSKVYYYEVADEGGSKLKGKGIQKYYKDRLITKELYKSVVDGSILVDYDKESISYDYTEIVNDKSQLKNTKRSKQLVTLVDLKYHYGDGDTRYKVYGSI